MKQIEKYSIEKLKRSELKAAPYNPRKISKTNLEKLKKYIRLHGLVQPIIYNKQTGNIVGGHQRIQALDDIQRGKDYEITCAVVDVDEKEEIKLNLLLNNQGLQGEYDSQALIDIKNNFGDLNFLTDFGFEKLDLDFHFANVDDASIFKETEEQKQLNVDLSKIKKQREKLRGQEKNEQIEGNTRAITSHDFSITIVFNSNRQKQQFLIDKKLDPNKNMFTPGEIFN